MSRADEPPSPRRGLPPERDSFPPERIKDLIRAQSKNEEHSGWIVSRFARIRHAIAAAGEALTRLKLWPPSTGGGGGTPGEIPPAVAEALRKHMESFVNQSEKLVTSVRSAVNSCVRNEIHMKRIEDRVISIEASVQEAASSGKEALEYCKNSQLLTDVRYSSLRSTLDSVLTELKSSRKTPAVEKTWVEKYDEAIENFDIVSNFPERIWKQIDRVVRYATVLELVLRCIGSSDSPTYEKMDLVTYNLKEMKETCNELSLIDGTYSEIGKKATDLLYQYYVNGVKAVLFADATDGAVLHRSMNEILADLTLESNATLKSNHMEFTLNVQNLYFPFVKGGLSVPLPWRSAEAHIHMLHDYGAVDAKLNLTASPTLNLSCLFGVKSFCFGGECAVNSSGTFSKYNAGVSFSYNHYCASLKLQDKCQKLSASLFGKLSVISYAVEYVHDLSSGKKKKHHVVAGVSGKLNIATEIKAFVDSNCFAGGAVEYRWRPKSAVAFSFKVDMKDMRKTPQVGLSVEFGLKSR